MTSADPEVRTLADTEPADVVKDPLKETAGPPRLDAHGCSSSNARVENRSQVHRTPGNLQTRA
ncbi:MAG: hypothetical protein KTR35_12460 [Gammaproteobacteria bacterium]|nr:hypothetical protein [Gammaproteobacteria bacterium]